MLDQQRAPSPQHSPSDSGSQTSTSSNGQSVSAAQGSDAWLFDQQEGLGNAAFQGLLSGDESSETAPDYESMPANSRGGFTARVLKAAGQDSSPEDVLSSGQYEHTATRAEAAVILARVLGFGDSLEGQPGVFSDVPLSHWAAAAIYRCREEGLLSGAGENKFNPDDALSADHATTFITRTSSPAARTDFQRDDAVAESDAGRELPEGGADKADGPMRSTGNVYRKHEEMVGEAEIDLSDSSHSWAMGAFKRLWEKNQARYEAVADQVNVPAPLIAALHMRESSGKFNTYLHQGDPLGRPAVNWPNNIPVFHVWEDAAIHALNQKGWLRDDLGMTAQTTDMAAMATYAEHYNGLGYHNRDRVSPYVYAGTDQYTTGKYVADGKFSSTTKDKQLGVMAMLQGVGAGQAAPGSLVEGQVIREGVPVANAQVVITDAKDQRFETTASAKGFFSLEDGAAVGQAVIEVEGVRQPMEVTAGGASWTSFHLDAPAPMPEVTPEPQTETSTLQLELNGGLLRKGAKGQQVRTLQELLNTHGADLTVDGDFGRGTEGAVKSFQSAQGLTADGVVGKNTASALNQSPAGATTEETSTETSGGETATETATETSNETSNETAGETSNETSGPVDSPLTSLTGTLRRGAKGEMVTALQERLNAHGAGIKVDGDFGPGTERAVKAFQTMMGLSIDGVVGRNTVSKLVQAPGQIPDTNTGGGSNTSGGDDTQEFDGTTEERGALAARSARIEYLEGRARYGEGSWETQGTNRGAMVNEFKASSGARGDNGYAWCGMFVGHHFKKAGIRQEILRNLVFWSGLRLHKFFEEGGYVATSQSSAGSWWKPHQSKSLKGLTGSRRKAALDEFGPQEGDIALFRNDYSHVAIITGYDEATGELQIIEGNRGNRVQATVYGTGDGQITYIGRFNDSDFEPNGEVDSELANAANPRVTHDDAAYASTR